MTLEKYCPFNLKKMIFFSPSSTLGKNHLTNGWKTS